MTKEKLWKLRNEIVLNSGYASDYLNDMGYAPEDTIDFFQRYGEYLLDKAQENGTVADNAIDDYDNADSLWDYWQIDPQPLKKSSYNPDDYRKTGTEHASDREHAMSGFGEGKGTDDTPYWRKAMMLNDIISCSNDEGAYGSWIYVWPDEESEEQAKQDFGTEEDYRELEDYFKDVYRDYHDAGLYNAPEDVVAAAHAWDAKLGLKPIKVIGKVNGGIGESDETKRDMDRISRKHDMREGLKGNESDSDIMDILGIDEKNRCLSEYTGMIPQYRELRRRFPNSEIWMKGDVGPYTDGGKVVGTTADLAAIDESVKCEGKNGNTLKVGDQVCSVGGCPVGKKGMTITAIDGDTATVLGFSSATPKRMKLSSLELLSKKTEGKFCGKNIREALSDKDARDLLVNAIVAIQEKMKDDEYDSHDINKEVMDTVGITKEEMKEIDVWLDESEDGSAADDGETVGELKKNPEDDGYAVDFINDNAQILLRDAISKKPIQYCHTLNDIPASFDKYVIVGESAKEDEKNTLIVDIAKPDEWKKYLQTESLKTGSCGKPMKESDDYGDLAQKYWEHEVEYQMDYLSDYGDDKIKEAIGKLSPDDRQEIIASEASGILENDALWDYVNNEVMDSDLETLILDGKNESLKTKHAVSKLHESDDTAAADAPKCPCEVITSLIDDEKEAVDGYDKASMDINGIKDGNSAASLALFAKIKQEELEHIKELQGLLDAAKAVNGKADDVQDAAEAASDDRKIADAFGDEPVFDDGNDANQLKPVLPAADADIAVDADAEKDESRKTASRGAAMTESLRGEDAKHTARVMLKNSRKPMNESLTITKTMSLEEFQPWSGAVDTMNKIINAGKLDDLDFLLEDQYPEGIDETDLNDLLWFESDWVLDQLGLKDDDVEPDDDKPEEETEPEDGVAKDDTEAEDYSDVCRNAGK